MLNELADLYRKSLVGKIETIKRHLDGISTGEKTPEKFTYSDTGFFAITQFPPRCLA